jgi:hypothetical protein
VSQQPAPPVAQPQGGVYYTPQGAVQPQQPYQPAGQYPQQTTQMPAQQPPVAGAYGQPAYGQPYAPAAPGQYPPAPYPMAPGQPYPYPQAKGRGGPILGLLGLIAAGVVVGSTFLPWLSAMGFTTTGWSIMRGASSLGGSSFTLWETGNGAIFFSGFFSLLLGAMVLFAAIITFFRRRVGGVIAFIFALLATGVAAVNIAMVLTKMNGVSVGYGLWMFLGGAALALVVGIIAMVSAG